MQIHIEWGFLTFHFFAATHVLQSYRCCPGDLLIWLQGFFVYGILISR